MDVLRVQGCTNSLCCNSECQERRGQKRSSIKNRSEVTKGLEDHAQGILPGSWGEILKEVDGICI